MYGQSLSQSAGLYMTPFASALHRAEEEQGHPCSSEKDTWLRCKTLVKRGREAGEKCFCRWKRAPAAAYMESTECKSANWGAIGEQMYRVLLCWEMPWENLT